MKTIQTDGVKPNFKKGELLPIQHTLASVEALRTMKIPREVLGSRVRISQVAAVGVSFFYRDREFHLGDDYVKAVFGHR